MCACLHVCVYASMCVFVCVCACASVLVLVHFSGEWITPKVTGNRPPPTSSFTVTSVNNNTAVFFGGSTTNGRSNNVYIFNFTKTSIVSVLMIVL